MTDTGTPAGKAAFAAALTAVVIGLGVLAGWLFGVDFLKSLVPGLTPMNPTTAAVFVFAGVSLALFLRFSHGKDQQSRVLVSTARLCALVAAMTGLIKLAGYLCGLDLGMDQWLFASKLPQGGHSPLIRIAPNTALNFLLFGGALLFVDVKIRFVRSWIEFFVGLVSFGALLGILGHAYHIQQFYGIGGLAPMSLYTAIAFAVLSAAFFLSHTDSGLLAVIAGDNAGGTMARRLLPAAILVPAALGWLTLQGEKAGIYNGGFGEAVFAAGIILAFTLVVCWSAKGVFTSELGRKIAEEALRRANEELEARIAHRTADLEKANEALRVKIIEQKRAEETLRESEEKFRSLFEGSRDAIMTSEAPDWSFTSGNPAAVKMFEAKNEEEFIAYGPVGLSPDRQPDGRASAEKAREMIETAMLKGFHFFEWTHRRIGGGEFPAEVLLTAMERGGKVVVQGSVRDITERKRIEARMFQSQKMETVGQLAGGVAHEFNSILTAIIGQSELLLGDLPPDDPLVKNAREIRQAADRAATLTRQLLAYGRKQILQPEILDLNRVLSDMAGTLRHLMGREVDVRIVPGAGLKTVRIDPGQIEQVIVNIAMNAADAMPNGGKLTLETANVTLDEEYVRPFPGLKAGGYVRLAITDTGIGMSEEVKARVFEPFFSTKAVGQGTGLGLATCYGILKQSDGHINVYSEAARGAAFKIYLPQVEEPEITPLPRPASPDLPRGTETILLAEDDPSLREMSATLLRRLGYTVLTAANGVEALNLKQQRDIGHIDLLFTDVVMPHMSGKELSDRIRTIYPHTRILFTSAYTESAIVHQGILNEGVALLQKPFTPSALAHKVREILDR